MGFFFWKKSAANWNKSYTKSYDYKSSYKAKSYCEPEQLKKVEFKSFDLKSSYSNSWGWNKADCKPLEVKAIDCAPLPAKTTITSKVECKPIEIKPVVCEPAKTTLKSIKEIDCDPKTVELEKFECKTELKAHECKPLSFWKGWGFSSKVECKVEDYKCAPVVCAPVATAAIAGTVFVDANADGINGETVVTTPGAVEVVRTVSETIEAEDMDMDGFRKAYGKNASDKKLAKLKYKGEGSLSTEFDGESASYDVTIYVQDECDGESTIGLYVNDVLVQNVVLDQNDDGRGSNNSKFSTVTIEGVDIEAGDKIELRAEADGREYVRIDKITLDAEITEMVTPDATEEYTAEAPREGVTVTLLDDNGDVVATTETDENGDYRFDDLDAGDYRVEFTAPDGTAITLQDQGDDDAIDSDADASGQTALISLEEGEEIVTIDAGLIDAVVPVAPALPGTLTGTLFNDENGNGQQDAGEAGVANQIVGLAGIDSVKTTVTDADGNYIFEDLDAGDYRVTFTEKDGYVFTTEGAAADIDVDGDSDADEGNGTTELITINSGETVTTIDAGLIDSETAAITGRYFRDENGNDIDDTNGADLTIDPGVVGSVVELLDAAGNPVLDANGTPVVALTDAKGEYAFEGLAAGTYGVRFAAVADMPFIASNTGADDRDSDAVPSDDQATATISTITIAAGEVSTDNDAGVELVNEAPVATADDAMTCADKALSVDVLSNDADAEGDVTIIEVGGQPIAEGQTVTVDGVLVTLSGGQLVVDGSNAHVGLSVGEMAQNVISYKIADEGGLTSEADLTVTFKGLIETRGEIGDDLPEGQVRWEILDTNNPSGSSDDAYTVTLLETGDADLDGTVYEEAYCLDILLDDGSPRVELDGGMTLADDFTFADTAGVAGDKIDNMLDYVLNTDWAAAGYTDAEVQGALWEFFNGNGFVSADAGTTANAQEILSDVIANGQNFEAGEGDDVAVILQPDEQSYQPFVIGLAWEEAIC